MAGVQAKKKARSTRRRNRPGAWFVAIGERVLVFFLACASSTEPDPDSAAETDATGAEFSLGDVAPCNAPIDAAWALAWGGADMGASHEREPSLIEPGALALVGGHLYATAPGGGGVGAEWQRDAYPSPVRWDPIIGAFSQADLEIDGMTDLLLAGTVPGLVQDVEGTDTAETRLLYSTLDGGFVREIAPADFTGDGLPDLFVQFTAGDAESASLRPVLSINHGDGAFVSTLPVAASAEVGGSVADVLVLDADADDDPDVLVCHDDGVTTPLQLLVNEGGVFTPAPAGTFSTTGSCASLATGALGSTGAPAVIATFADHLERWLPSADGWTEDPAFVDVHPADPATLWGAQSVDLDNDGDEDVVVAEAERFVAGAGVHPLWFAWNDAGTWRLESAVDETMAHSLVVRDVNGDGVADLVVGDARWSPRVLASAGCTENAWLDVDAPFGTRAWAEVAGTVVASGVVTSEAGAGSSAPPVLHLGLGAIPALDRLTLAAPDGSGFVVDSPIDVRRTVRWRP